MDWVLLRGLTREQRHWSPAFLEALGRHGRLHLLDLPGVGTEAHRPSPTVLRGITDDLRARRPLGPGPWGLLTISLGGMVGMDWVARYPSDFTRVVLINTSASDLAPPWRRMQLQVVPTLARGLLGDRLARERAILIATTTTRGADRALAETWAAYATERPLHRGAAAAQLLAALRFRSPARLPVPSLVLVGQGDRLCAPSCGEGIAARYGSAIARHPTAGHDLPLDEPEWTAAQIATFGANATATAAP